MANPRGQLLLRCGSTRARMMRVLLIAVPVGFATVVIVAGLITGYWAFMIGIAVFMLVALMLIFLYMSRPVAVYENGIVAGSFRR